MLHSPPVKSTSWLALVALLAIGGFVVYSSLMIGGVAYAVFIALLAFNGLFR